MSTIPDVIAALVELGEATLDKSRWQTIDGPATTTTTTRARVFLVADREIVSPTEYDSFGGASEAERYTVPLVVSISLPGADTLSTVRREALDAYELIRDAVLAAPGRNLGLSTVVDVYPTQERRVQQSADANGRSVSVRFGVDVYAQL